MSAVEEWRPVPGWEGVYEVSESGRLHSVRFNRAVKGFVTEKGYLRYNLHRDGIRSTGRAHVLVMLAFVGPKPDGMQVCHNDGDKLNNHVSNLRYDTPHENSLDVVRHGHHHQASKTHCSRGHEFTPENTRFSEGGRHRRCRPCKSYTDRLLYLRASGAAS